MDTPTTVKRPHPAARLFSEEARRAVAEGPLFDSDGNIPTRYNDGCCIVGALLHEQWPDLPLDADSATPDSYQISEIFAEKANAPLTPADMRSLGWLMERNDRGVYADRATLRRDLLGEVQP